MYRLLNSEGKEVKKGDKYTDFRGEEHKVISFSPPHKPSSAGFVYTEQRGGWKQEFYVTVLGLKWVHYENNTAKS